MRRAPLVTFCAASALAASALVPMAAAQPSGEAAGRLVTAAPDVPPARPVAAQRTLDAVERAFSGAAPQTEPGGGLDHGRDLTLLLRDLRAQLPALRGEDRRQARGWLARPTDRFDRDSYGAPAENDCDPGEPGEGTGFCIHWVESTGDAPPLTDTSPANGFPDQVDRTRATMQHVWDREIGDGGFRRPVRDAGPPEAGPTRGFDVYLANIGFDRLYGYCSNESAPGDGRDYAAYCVLDDDYSSAQFPQHTPLQNLQVTAAHEFFHAIQFAYDTFEDTWLMEGTATWIEDEIYDGVDDNRLYLRTSPLSAPDRPLDKGSDLYVYGVWLWWRYLTEQHGTDRGTGIPTLIRRIWEEADDSDASRPGTYSLKATRRILAKRGSSLTQEVARFAVANRHPQASYEEGGAYGAARLDSSTRLSEADPSVPERVVRVDHLASRTFAFRPSAGLAQGGWRLRARVDAPGSKHSPVAQLTTVRRDGRFTTERLDLDADGIGRATVGFDSDTVLRVELTLTNAGHRYDCGQGTVLSCRGVSKSNDRPFTYKVRLRR